MRIVLVFAAGAVALATAGAAPVFAAQSFVCTFTKECIAGEPCEARADLTSKLEHGAQGWFITLPDGAGVTFEELAGAPEGSLRLISTDLDPDASAIALLSVAKGGRAILSIQGYFPDLGAVTQLGQCLPEGG